MDTSMTLILIFSSGTWFPKELAKDGKGAVEKRHDIEFLEGTTNRLAFRKPQGTLGKASFCTVVIDDRKIGDIQLSFKKTGGHWFVGSSYASFRNTFLARGDGVTVIPDCKGSPEKYGLLLNKGDNLLVGNARFVVDFK